MDHSLCSCVEVLRVVRDNEHRADVVMRQYVRKKILCSKVKMVTALHAVELTMLIVSEEAVQIPLAVLAEKLAISVSSVRRLIRLLEQSSLIQVERIAGVSGAQQANVYRLVSPVLAQKRRQYRKASATLMNVAMSGSVMTDPEPEPLPPPSTEDASPAGPEEPLVDAEWEKLAQDLRKAGIANADKVVADIREGGFDARSVQKLLRAKRK